MHRLSQTVLVFVFALGVATSVQAAPDEDAKRLYDQGLRDLKTHRFADAALAFEAAFGAQPHPASLFMAAGAWQEAGSLARAADAWARCLTVQGLNPAQKDQAIARLASIEMKVGTVAVSFAGGALGWEARLAEGSFFALPARLHATPGLRRLEVRDAEGQIHPELGHTLQLGAGNAQTLVLTLPQMPSVVPVSDILGVNQNVGPEKSPGISRTRVAAAAGLATLGVGCFVGSAIMWGRANATHDDFEKTPTWKLHDQGVSQVRWTNALGAAGSVLLLSGVAVALWPAAIVQPVVSAHGWGVAGVF